MRGPEALFNNLKNVSIHIYISLNIFCDQIAPLISNKTSRSQFITFQVNKIMTTLVLAKNTSDCDEFKLSLTKNSMCKNISNPLMMDLRISVFAQALILRTSEQAKITIAILGNVSIQIKTG